MDDERLIVEVEKHKIIYETNHPFYKDNGRKEKAWHLIAAVLGVDADMCKARWKALRDTFVKNRKKGIPSGSAGGTQKDWKYAEIMSFVLPHLQPRSSTSNVGSGTPLSDRSEGRSSTPGISLQQPSTSPAPSTSALSASRSRSPRDRNISRPAVAAQAPRETRRGQRPLDTGIGDRLMSLLEQPVPKPHIPDDELDEAYHFAMSIVPMLHRLNKDSRQQAKIEILTVLHRLERSFKV
ncbi:transcription factor Adf-1-like [Gadus chalcogrammus]|uniref:transcription factor Adf-1-like n=1 Tax=Gadus chalcogrammus TaxID=1042646 RepID=UPI0024C48E47|nr:transcription factor Adf-1-like [Gadus chalcogrammus]